MLCEKILGNINNTNHTKAVETVDFEWHEIYKKLHKKITSSGEEIGIRLDNDILKKGQADSCFSMSAYIHMVVYGKATSDIVERRFVGWQCK